MGFSLRWLLLCIVVLAAAACESTADVQPTATSDLVPATAEPTEAPTLVPRVEATAFFGRAVQPGRGTASLRVIHAASQAPVLTIALDDAPFVGSLSYGLATGLTTTMPGTYTLRAAVRGGEDAIAETELTLAAGRTTEVVVVPSADGIQFKVLDGPAEALEAGKAVVRAIHALDGDEDVSVILNGTRIPESLTAGAATGLLAFDAGDLTAEFVSGPVSLLTDRRRLRELTNMLVVLAGSPDRPQVFVFESPVLSRYSLRVVNMSPDAREIDVYFDDALVAGNLGYQGITDRTVYASAPASVSVHAANADLAVSPPLLDDYRVVPRPGSDVTLAIYGPVSDLRAVWIEQDMSPVPVGQSRMVFVHVLTGASAVRVGVNATDLEEVRPFNYGGVSDPVLFDQGEIRLFVRDAAEPENIIELHQFVPIPAGNSILYFVTGIQPEENAPPLVFAEPVGVDENLTAEPVEPSQGRSRIRYVNAIVSRPVLDVMQDGATLVSDLEYGQGSELFPVVGTSVQINAHMSTSAATLVDQHIGLPEDGDYTLFIFGTPDTGITTLLLNDKGLTTQLSSSATVRLVNLTPDPFARFGLGMVPVQALPADRPTPEPTLEPTATIPGDEPLDVGRPRLPIGVAVPIVGIDGGTASRQAVGQPGSRVFVITGSNEIVATIDGVEFAPGTHTDIVAFEYRTATTIDAAVFALVYPSR